jgi:hypothetical protein
LGAVVVELLILMKQLYMKHIQSIMAIIASFPMLSCGVFGLRFHQTDAQEHDFNDSITDKVTSDGEILAIMRHHHEFYGETKEHPSFYVASNLKSLVYAEMGQDGKTGDGKYILTTPNITNEEIETYWNVYRRVVAESGFKGKIVMDVYPDGKKKRFTASTPDRGHRH